VQVRVHTRTCIVYTRTCTEENVYDIAHTHMHACMHACIPGQALSSVQVRVHVPDVCDITHTHMHTRMHLGKRRALSSAQVRAYVHIFRIT
jgi:hypothetical protein